MSKNIKIRKGLDIKLVGKADDQVKTQIACGAYAVKPTDFTGVFPKLLVKEGDKVKAGTPLFFDKYREAVKFVSPVSGTVSMIKRGNKRVLQEIRIDADGENSSKEFTKADPNNLEREQIIEMMLESGTWPFVRQRPYSVIADPGIHPKAIVISAFDSNPLSMNIDVAVNGKSLEFQKGLDALRKLTPGKVYLNLKSGHSHSDVFTNAKGVDINYFDGPHPAGNIGIQIHHLDPINKGETIWYVHPQDIITIGRLFMNGVYDASKIIAVAGSEAKDAMHYEIKAGACVKALLHNTTNFETIRYISGNVLTGDQISKEGYLGFYHHQFTVIPEGKYHSFFGWLIPSLKKHSYYKTALSWLTPKKSYNLDTNLNGARRPFVVTGALEKVFPMNIYPMHLLKAIMIEDIDMMEQLGIYEVDSEDFALCEYISTSKIEMQDIVQKGLEVMRKEMS